MNPFIHTSDQNLNSRYVFNTINFTSIEFWAEQWGIWVKTAKECPMYLEQAKELPGGWKTLRDCLQEHIKRIRETTKEKKRTFKTMYANDTKKNALFWK